MGAYGRFNARRLRAEESGFSLIEVMMAVALLSVVLGATLSLSHTGSRVAERDLVRANAIEEVQTGIARMDRELRTATEVITPTSSTPTNSVDFVARVSPSGGGARVLRRVRYSCDVPSPTIPTLRACFRYEGPTTGTPGGGGTLVVDQLVNGTAAIPVFTANASPPTYFSIHLQRSAKGTLQDGYDYSITHDHGVYLRAVDGSV
jgi:prepilin-type N-terminal cleavage/methylation domain-containing protein